ncbi:MAG: hypothetical protein ACRDL7_00095 [Gaiellaceae bacterium]
MPVSEGEVERIVRPSERQHGGGQEDITIEDEEIVDVFKDFPQNEPCIELSRTTSTGGRPMFLENIAPSKWSFAYVADRFGGGYYVLKGKFSDGSARKTTFEIEGDPFPVKRVQVSKNPLDAVLPGGNQSHLTATPAEIVPASQDGIQTMIAAMMSMMKTMVQELRGSEVEMLTKMKMYKDLFAPATEPRQEAPFDQAFSMLQKGMELGQMAGASDNASMTMMIIKELKDPVMKIVEAVSAKRIPPVPLPPSPGLPGEPPKEHMVLTALRAFIPQLLTAATKNSDPSIYIDFILDQVPPLYYDKVKEWLQLPDVMDQLCKAEPGIKFQLEWWNALRLGLIQAITEEGGTEEGRNAAGTVQPESALDSATGGSADL